MDEPELLPLHLALSGRRVLVVGGGAVAARKVMTCLRSGADVVVVAPSVGQQLAGLAAAGRIRWRRRPFRRGDLRSAWLVYTATGVPDVDARVGRGAERRRLLCIRADDGRAGTARSAAVLRHQGLLIGISSADRPDPARLVRVRDALARELDGVRT
ncbi:siroheme synthase, N-terminal domain-containing protein [Nakamurella panacisegetis]|uniref:precorrin-2 dehydrogenase n=1 Tax=Nakamurella panacisegetis TaxID=1090615 RepID=A0A1H0SHX9_9ACTN|nr:NAD(P)-dependent oxidoreductase [Nakamurella panacisegetis]SDP41275.1 siroheme synthase, N-terminal domain-containing protein [Nakamurella panacisegetis]